MAIDFRHPEYEKYLPIWQKISDLVDQEDVEKYLRVLEKYDDSQENAERNREYRDGAIFYPVAEHTAEYMLGSLFSRWPELSIPTQLEYLKINCDGSGNSIYQQSQQAAWDLISVSRSGLSVSFPKTEGGVSMADISSGLIFATIERYDPRQIINWRKMNVGSKSVLSLVVLRDKAEEIGEDGYSIKYVDTIREMYLRNGIYGERLWRKNKDDEWYVFDEYIPVDSNDLPWNEIPFTFIGARNNDSSIDKPTMRSICDITKGIYRNSADVEDSSFYVGQPQPWMSGVTQDYIEEARRHNLHIGSRRLIAVPSGERFEFAAAPANSYVNENMQNKFELARMFGARLMMPIGPARTATEVQGDQVSQHSIISLISSNLSEAYTKAIGWCGRYMNADTTDSYYKTTMDFKTHDVVSDELRVIMEGFMQRTYPASDYHNYLKLRDLTDKEKTLEQFLEELDVVGGGMPDLGGE